MLLIYIEIISFEDFILLDHFSSMTRYTLRENLCY